MGPLTNDAKDAQDVRGKDNQQVDEREQRDGNSDVAGPVEGLVGEHHLLDCSPHLIRIKKKKRQFLYVSLHLIQSYKH